MLWVVGLAAVVAGFVLLFENPGTPTWTEIVNRAAGGSFIVCGLIVWQRRPDSRTGLWMTATGFLYLGPQLLEEIDTSVAYTIGEVLAVVWLVPFAALVLGYPTGRLTGPVDWIPVGGVRVRHDGDAGRVAAVPAGGRLRQRLDDLVRRRRRRRDRHDAAHDQLDGRGGRRGDRAWRAGGVPRPRCGGCCCRCSPAGSRPPCSRRQAYYRLLAGEWMRPTFEITSVVLFLIPLAFLVGALRAQMARAGMADLVVALHRAQDAKGLGDVLARTLRDPSLELVYWLPGFETYVDDEGKPVALPAAGSGRAATPVMHDGEPVAALVHDAALTYEPELLEVVTAAADVALERRRLHAELESRVEELAGSRARIVEASDAARRQIERDLHDGAQQRLVSLAIALRLTEDRIKDDPETAATLVAAARRELTESLEELRELARGIHPAVLEHGLDTALQSLATRSQTPVRLEVELDERLPVPVELAAYFVACEGLANVGKYAQASEAVDPRDAARRRRRARGQRRRHRRRRQRRRLRAAWSCRPGRGDRRPPARDEPGGRRHEPPRRAAGRGTASRTLSRTAEGSRRLVWRGLARSSEFFVRGTITRRALRCFLRARSGSPFSGVDARRRSPSGELRRPLSLAGPARTPTARGRAPGGPCRSPWQGQAAPVPGHLGQHQHQLSARSTGPWPSRTMRAPGSFYMMYAANSGTVRLDEFHARTIPVGRVLSRRTVLNVGVAGPYHQAISSSWPQGCVGASAAIRRWHRYDLHEKILRSSARSRCSLCAVRRRSVRRGSLTR